MSQSQRAAATIVFAILSCTSSSVVVPRSLSQAGAPTGVDRARKGSGSQFLGCVKEGSLGTVNVVAIDPASSELAAWLQAEIDALGSEEHVAVSLSWMDGGNAIANGHDLLIGRDLAYQISALRIAEDRKRLLFRFLLAHEYAHVLQSGPVKRLTSTRERELQADLAAGLWVALRAASGGEPLVEMSDPARYVAGLGDAKWRDRESHGAPTQREAAFNRGYLASMAGRARTPGYRVSTLMNEFSEFPAFLCRMEELTAEWNQYTLNVYAALTSGGTPPSTPGGVSPAENGATAWSYVFKPAEQDRSATALWRQLLWHIKVACASFSSDLTRGRITREHILARNEARARAAVHDDRAIRRRSVERQEIPQGGVHVALEDLELSSSAHEHRIVLTFSLDEEISDEERWAALAEAANREQHRARRALSPGSAYTMESLEQRRQRWEFLSRLRDGLASAPVDDGSKLDELALPQAVQRGAYYGHSRAYVVTDTANSSVDDEMAQWEAHLAWLDRTEDARTSDDARNTFLDESGRRAAALAVGATDDTSKLVAHSVYELDEISGCRIGIAHIAAGDSRRIVVYTIWP